VLYIFGAQPAAQISDNWLMNSFIYTSHKHRTTIVQLVHPLCYLITLTSQGIPKGCQKGAPPPDGPETLQLFQCIIRMLLWPAVRVRPDIVFDVSFLGRFTSNAGAKQIECAGCTTPRAFCTSPDAVATNECHQCTGRVCVPCAEYCPLCYACIGIANPLPTSTTT
jgi:hypothetical protein